MEKRSEVSYPFGLENAALGSRALHHLVTYYDLWEKLYNMQFAERLAFDIPTGLLSLILFAYIPQLSIQLSIHYTKLFGASDG